MSGAKKHLSSKFTTLPCKVLPERDRLDYSLVNGSYSMPFYSCGLTKLKPGIVPGFTIQDKKHYQIGFLIVDVLL